MREIDLHVHTTASDGTLEPAEVVKLAAENGLRAVAITDHDTLDGHAEAMEAAKHYGVELVPGVELSTKYGVSVHILGYFIDPNSKRLNRLFEWIVDDRDTRNIKTVELMAQDGLDVNYDDMKKRFGEVIGRPHFGQLLVEFGKAESVADAFARYVGKGCPYYVPRISIPIDRAVESIVAAGGIAVLAHPFQYNKNDEELRELIEHCIEHGLHGMECRYSGYDAQQIEYLEKLADEYSLLKTGGSDFHGTNKKHISLGSGTGELNVPYEWLERLKEAHTF